MYRIIFIALGVVLLPAAAGHAGPVERSEFRYMAPVQDSLKPDVPVSVAMGREVISKTGPGFSDLRLFDNMGQEAPFVIYPEVDPGERREVFRFKVLSFDSSGGEVSMVLERPENEGPFSGIGINTPARDFRKSVTVFKGTDGKAPAASWGVLMSGMIFDFSSQVDLRQTALEIPPTDADLIRVVIEDESLDASTRQQMKLKYDGLEFEVGGKAGEGFRIDSVTGFRGEEKEGRTVYDRQVIREPAMHLDEDRNSVYELGRVNLGITRVRLQVEKTYYHRRVELWEAGKPGEDEYRLISAGTIYNIPGLEKPENTFDIRLRRYRHVRIKIINRDNPPLHLQSIVFEWPRQNLYFIPEKGREYTLFFGSENLSEPDYEIGDIIRNEPAELKGYDSLFLGAVQENAGYDPRLSRSLKDRLERGALIAIVLVLVAALSWWLFALMRKMTAGEGGGV